MVRSDLSILAKAAHASRESRAEGRGMAAMFEPKPRQGGAGRVLQPPKKHETFGVKKSTQEREAKNLPHYHHKKSLGQNFLVDRRVQEKIIQACHLSEDDMVVEIGPGLGALTQLIAPKVKKLICVEADRDLISALKAQSFSIDVIHADFLKWNLGPLPNSLKVIGNIPYYISTPIIEKLIAHRKKITSAFLTVQLEFGKRLAAKTGDKKDYGSLSCFVQYYADVNVLFKIKNTCFKPAPKVESCFLCLTMRPQPEVAVPDEAFLFKLIQTAFQQRRKTLVNALKNFVGKEKLESALRHLGFNLNVRPENLTLSDYVCLCNKLMI